MARAVPVAHEADNVRGALWMLASAVLFTGMTVLIKLLGDSYSPALQTFYRQWVGLAVLVPLMLRGRGAVFATDRRGQMLVRSSITTLAMMLSYYAFQKMPLAEANALSFTRTLWVVPLAIVMLRETVGAMRIGASLVGFGGVMVMLWPGMHGGAAASIGVPGLAMLLASLLFALGLASMKMLSRDHSPNTLLVWSAVLGAVFAVPGAVLTWRWPDASDLLLLCLMGALGVANQACYIRGIHAGDAAAMAPIDYTRLVFSATAGFFLFGELPAGWTVAGALIIVGSTLFITLREFRKRRPVVEPVPEL